MKKKTFADFNLKKVKIHTNEDVEVLDIDNYMVENSRERDDNSKKTSVTPSPDLRKSLDALKPFLAECYGINFADEFLTAEGLDQDKIDAFKVVKPIIRREYKSIMNLITITGLSISGSEDTLGVVISGKILQPNKSKTALNSPNIRLNLALFGFETELSDCVNKVIEEVYEFRYNGKRAQYEMFNEPKKVEEEAPMKAIAV